MALFLPPFSYANQVLHDLKKAYFPVNPDREVNEVPSSSSTGNAKAKDTHKEAEVALWETRFLTMLRRVFKEANFQQLSHESMMAVLQVLIEVRECFLSSRWACTDLISKRSEEITVQLPITLRLALRRLTDVKRQNSVCTF